MKKPCNGILSAKKLKMNFGSKIFPFLENTDAFQSLRDLFEAYSRCSQASAYLGFSARIEITLVRLPQH